MSIMAQIHARCVRPLTCPTCYEPLQRDEGRLLCPAGHSFDLAREGYVNLLPTNRRLADTVGDSAEMLHARRRFLESGMYKPLADRIGLLAAEYLIGYAQDSGTAPTLLDCGCGEGYYGEHVRQHMAAKPGPLCSFGLDVAKTAVKMAAKKYPLTQFVAANVNGRIPFADHSINLLLNIFAPRNPAEFARISAGSLLVAIPAPDHLLTLRHTLNLLEIEVDKQSKVQAQLQSAFHLIHEELLAFPLVLNSNQLQNLVHMTPNARHLTPMQARELAQFNQFHTDARLQILVFRRRSEVGS